MGTIQRLLQTIPQAPGPFGGYGAGVSKQRPARALMSADLSATKIMSLFVTVANEKRVLQVEEPR